MPNSVIAPLHHMQQLAGQTVNCFGKDQTGHVQYKFNRQGWRSDVDYDFVPSHAFFGNSTVFGIGVNLSQRFSETFDRSHNYGLAGSYSNRDIAETVIAYLNSDLYNSGAKIAVLWTDRDAGTIDEYWPQLDLQNIVHLFCAPTHLRGHAMLPSVDQDASGTHAGPKTHRLLGLMLCKLFNQ